MTVISLVQSNIIRSRAASKDGSPRRIRTKKLVVMILISAIALAAFFYVVQTSSITAKDYEIRKMRKQINELENKNRELQITISDLKSINVLESRTESFGMIKAQSIEYLAIPPADVAAAR